MSRPKRIGAGKRALDPAFVYEKDGDLEEEEQTISKLAGPSTAKKKRAHSPKADEGDYDDGEVEDMVPVGDPDAFDDAADNALEMDAGNMTASRAKSTFALNERDLQPLAFFNAENPHYASAAPMRLYDIAALRSACLAKYGDAVALAAKLRSNAGKANKARATRIANAQKRRLLPAAAAGAGGVAFDDDDEGEYDDDDDRNDDVCDGCGATAARECANGMCCHCCKEASHGDRYACMRHGGL